MHIVSCLRVEECTIELGRLSLDVITLVADLDRIEGYFGIEDDTLQLDAWISSSYISFGKTCSNARAAQFNLLARNKGMS